MHRRFERKFRSGLLDADEVVHRLKLHPAVFTPLYPDRAVNSVYLDDAERSGYFAHVAGQSHRVKVRVRWYGDLLGLTDGPALELKYRENYHGYKVRWPLPPFAFTREFSRDRLSTLLRAIDVPALRLEWIEGLDLVLATRYRRRYLLSADRRFRVTVDSGMTFYGLGRHAAGLTRRMAVDGCVIELKYDFDDDDEAERVASRLPFRLIRNSKYIEGMDRLYG